MPGVSALLEKASATFGAIPAHVAAAPYLAGVYALVALFFGLFAAALLRGRYTAASRFIALALATAILFDVGHDLHDHVGRLLLLKEGLTGGSPSLFVEVGDVSLPVFYYYSTGVYVFALPLTALGLSAVMALRIVMVGFFLAMAFGARRLFAGIVAQEGDRGEGAGLLAIVFLTANYVYLDFAHRNAFPEAAVYALIPLVVLALRAERTLLAVALVALQASLHPAVFPQAATAAVLAHLVLTPRPLPREALRLLLVFAAGVVLSSPSWVLAFANKDEIAGVDGLPVAFEDTFLRVTDIFRFHHYASPGLALFVLLPLVFWTCRGRRGAAGLLLVAAVATLVLQLEIAKPLVRLIPLADLGLFIWRWMFVTIWFGVLALAVAWCAGMERWGVRALVLIAGLLAVVLVGLRIEPAASDNAYAGYADPDRAGTGAWGFGEYYPRYGTPPEDCAALGAGESRRVPFSALTAPDGVTSALPLAVPGAPVGIVSYSADGAPVVGIGCDDTLYLQPPAPGAASVFRAEPDLALRHPVLKVLFPVLPLILTLLAWAWTFRRRQPQGAS